MARTTRWSLWAAAVALIGVVAASQAGPKPSRDSDAYEVRKTEEEWKKALSPTEYRILRKAGTERPFTGEFWKHHEDGVYVCGGCGQPLFDSTTKFKSGTGWPSYYAPLDDEAIQEVRDMSYGMVRTEVRCSKCGGHLGHVFDDGPPPTGMRYCIISAALDFQARTKTESSKPSGEPDAVAAPARPE